MKTHRLVWLSLVGVLVLWTSLGLAEQPRYGGTLRIAWPGDPAFFDANQGPAQGAPAGWLMNNMYNSLLKLTPPPELTVVPELAKSWEVLDEGKTYVLTGCKFSAAQELLVVATGEGNSSIRAWCGQKNAEDSGAQPGTKCR